MGSGGWPAAECGRPWAGENQSLSVKLEGSDKQYGVMLTCSCCRGGSGPSWIMK